MVFYEYIVRKDKEVLIQRAPIQPCVRIAKEQVDKVIGAFEETLREL